MLISLTAPIPIDSSDCDYEYDAEPSINHANMEREPDNERNSRINSNEGIEDDRASLYSYHANEKPYVEYNNSDREVTDEDESNYVYMDSPAMNDSDDEFANVKMEPNGNDDDDDDYEINGDDIDSMSGSHISTEEMDVKAEIEAMIESDLASEQCGTDKINEIDEVYLEEIDFDIDESEHDGAIDRNVDSPASFSTYSSRRTEYRTIDVPEFLNSGSYRADFDVTTDMTSRPESPLNLVNAQYELQICDFCADFFPSRKMVRFILYFYVLFWPPRRG